MKSALLLGGARCLHADMAGALELFTPTLIIACNHAGRDHPGHVDHWVSIHVEQFPRWMKEREALGHAPAGQLWTGGHRSAIPGLDVNRAPNWGGSSGLVMVTAGLALECERMVLCGVPLDPEEAHYDDAERWRDAGNYRRGWTTHADEMNSVRSCSGWTRKLLGAPTREWLEEW